MDCATSSPFTVFIILRPITTMYLIWVFWVFEIGTDTAPIAGFLSHQDTPRCHPFFLRIFHGKPTILRYTIYETLVWTRDLELPGAPFSSPASADQAYIGMAKFQKAPATSPNRLVDEPTGGFIVIIVWKYMEHSVVRGLTHDKSWYRVTSAVTTSKYKDV